GTYETPEFQRQTRDFYAAVKAAGKSVELIVGEGYNHFEMLETLANPYGVLGRAVLAQMRLPPAAQPALSRMPSPRNPARARRRPRAAPSLPGAGGAAWAHGPRQPPRVKGPLVWLDMDQQDLDDAYDQLVYAPNRDHILERCARNSGLARARLGAPKRFAYG